MPISTGQITITDLFDGNNGKDAISAVLSNDSHVIPTDASGNNGVFTNATSTIKIMNGTTDDTANWTISTSASSGVTGSYNSTTKTYTVTGLTVDAGYVDFTATRSGYATQTKRFSITKSKKGSDALAPTFRKVRYIRDWLSGSSAGTGNHWVQVTAMAGSVNRALGKTPTSNLALTNPTYATNGNFTTGNNASGTGTQYLQIDLGAVYEDIDYLQIYHAFGDARIYNGTKTEISVDGTTWIAVFDSTIHGTYKETANGNTILLSSKPISSFPVMLESKVDGVDFNGNTIKSLISQSASTVKIEAEHIELRGKVTSDMIHADGLSFDVAKGGTLTLGGNIVTRNVTTNVTDDNGTVIGTETTTVEELENGMLVLVDKTGNPTATLDGESGGFDKLQVGKLISPTVVQTLHESVPFYRDDADLFVMYVDPEYGNDNSVTGYMDAPLASLQEAIDRIPKYIDRSITIYVRPTCLYNDDGLKIMGFHGDGNITIKLWDLGAIHRYIHITQNGSTANTGNHVVEFKAFDTAGVNQAYADGGNGRITGLNGVTITNPSYATDDAIGTLYAGFSSGLQTMQVYLGTAYDIAKFSLWGYYSDGRTYHDVKLTTGAATTGTRYTIFDSAYLGEYTETADGKHFSAKHWKLSGNVTVSGCSAHIALQDGWIDVNQINNHGIYALRSTSVRLDRCVIWGNPDYSSCYGIYASGNTYLKAYQTEINNCGNSSAISAYGSHVELVTCTGSGNSSSMYGFSASILAGTGTVPAVKSGGTLKKTAESGQVWHTATAGTVGEFQPVATATASPPPTAPPPPTPKTYTSTYTSTSLDNYDLNNEGVSYAYGWKGDNTFVGQGKWDIWGQYKGFYGFGSQLSGLAGKTILKVEVYLTRQSSSGNSGNTTIYIRTHNYTSKPSGNPTFSSSSKTASFARGASAWVDITSLAGAGIKAGTVKGIGLYAGSTSTSYYAKMGTTAKIRVTYQ